MATSLQDYLVKCPFYQNDEKGCIRCEGVIEHTRLKLSFVQPAGNTSQERKLDYLRKFCENDYESCRIFKMLEAKYE